jgi:hypothetical protein
MDGDGKPKHQVLQEFTAVLLRRNPMQLGQDNPLEYEAEALSILSRFTEAALQLPDDEAAVAEVATNIVKQSLEFWFDDIGGYNPEPLARELVGVFRAAFGGEPIAVPEEPTEGPAPEEPTPEEPKTVTEVTIGE